MNTINIAFGMALIMNRSFHSSMDSEEAKPQSPPAFIQRLKDKWATLERNEFLSLSAWAEIWLQKKTNCWFKLGKFFEYWQNLVDCNQNLGRLLLNLIQFHGNKLLLPDPESPKYLSFIGRLDRRTALDNNIKGGDKKYLAALSVMASKLVYENKAFCKTVIQNQWQMDLLESEFDFWNEHLERYSTQGIIIHDKDAYPGKIIVAFRGTEPFNQDDWLTDVDVPWFELDGMGRVHSGFMKALGLQMDNSWPPNIEENQKRPLAYYRIREKLRKLFQANSQTKFILTGHSLGGALAILFPAILALHKETYILDRLEAIYTFGQPRVGDEEFANVFNAHLERYGVKYCRFVYNQDIVPRLPADDDALKFRHFGKCIYFDSVYEGKIVPEVPYKNYFSLSGMVMRELDALWELFRSFLLPCFYGSDYSEGLLLIGSRLFALVFSGMPNHCPQDYVNAIRLGNDDLFG